jgi:nucleoside-diphosphate-sugar epimerase
VTGATGFLGSHLFIALCERGHPVTLLCRPAKGVPARDRVGAILAWFGRTFASYPGLKVVDGQIERPMLGMEPGAYRRLAAQTDEIVHCASSTDFSPRDRAAIESSNVQAVGNILEFAAHGRCLFFHYLSTAYVAGRTEGSCPEGLAPAGSFHNPYEETKHAAEHQASRECGRHGIRLSIYRPSIVYGDSRTGRSRKFNALYFPVRTILYLRDLLVGDLKNDGGRRARTLGAGIQPDGRVCMPIRMPARTGGTVNLIPVDFFTDSMIALMEGDLTGGVHHIANPSPNTLGDLVDYTNRFAGIEGLRAVDGPEEGSLAKNPLEQLFDSYIHMYRPYMSDLRLFPMGNTLPILQGKELACPCLTYDVFTRCMRYAMSVDWGKKL